MELNERLTQRLQDLERAALRRSVRVIPDDLIDFASNDYLGWTRHPALIEAAVSETQRCGTGATGSRLITGTTRLVSDLEHALAAWKKVEAALVFGSGFAAALGTIPAVIGRGDFVIVDKLAHACLIDAAKLSGATLRVFPHNNLIRLEVLLKSIRSADASAGILIVTESVFSMDGDWAPLTALVDLKTRFGAWLMVDEAHATGLYGKSGSGLISREGMDGQVDIAMGTFSKALGGLGGFVAGSRALVDTLVNRARSLIYSTALPPGVLAANLAAVNLAQSSVGDQARADLMTNISQFRAAFPRANSQSAIQPILCGSSEQALVKSKALENAGFYAPGIRFPSVPRNQARLRVTLSASHSAAEISGLANALQQLSREEKLA